MVMRALEKKAKSVPSTDGTRGQTINQKFPPPVETD